MTTRPPPGRTSGSRPGTPPATTDHAKIQSRNLEWWFLTHGRGTVVLGTPAGVTPDRDELFPGLYGEGPRLETAYAVQRAVLAGNAGSLPTGTLPPAAYYPYPGVSASQANTARGSGPDGDDDGDYLAGLRHVLPGLIFGGYDPLAPAASPVGRPMTAPADGVPLDRRGSGSWVNATGLGRLFLSAATASTDPAVGVRGRFPVLADAVLPLAYDDGTNVFGFANVTGPWQVVSDILNGLVLRSRDRTSANGTLPAEGGLAGVRTQPVAPGGTTALATGVAGVLDTFAGVSIDSLYGPLLGGTDAWRRFNHLRIDDPDETVADYRRAAGQRSDSLYGPAEFAGLHASRRDRTVRDDLPSRLVELVPMSFLESDDAEAVRRRFTTVSFDVTTAAAPFEPNDARRSAGGDDRAWERTEDDGTVPADGTPTEEEKFFPPVFDPGGGKTLLAQQDPFRPELRSALASGVYDRIPADNPATTRVDEEDVARRDARSLVRKMSLNGVLERVSNPRDPLFDSAAYYVNPRAAATNADGVSTNLDGDAATSELGFGEIRVRPLTPHPAGLSAGRFDPPVGHPLSAADYFGTKLKVGDLPRFGVSDADLQESLFNDATGRFEPRREGTLTWDFPSPRGNVQRALQLQEWHARRDRQNLARDIYVLLYTLGGVDGTLSDLDYRMPHPNPGTDHYTPDQLREMAQFAVNVVDAMDGDSVQTLFVYDKNLAGDGTDNNIDGYTVLDDGYAAPPAVDDPYRGLVVGVERQDFALSEALVNISWTSENGGGDDRFADHPRTEWNDAAMHDFAFVELYYTGPGAYDFGENADLAAAGLPDRPGENYRVILREPGGTRQFTGAADGASGNPLSRVTARALVPRAGAVSADRPYFTLASADPGYATGNGSAIDETTPTPQGPRSRIRVNLRSAAPAYGNSGTDEWTNLAPLAFAPAGMPTGPQVTQGSPVSTSGDGTTDPSQVLDVLVPADTLGDPALEPFGAEDRAAYRLFDLDPDGTVNAPTPINSISGADWLTLAGTDPEKQSSPPTVEVILQRRANPLRFRNNHAPGTDFDLEERDNPWVTIDRMRVRATQLALDEGEDGLTTPGNAATAPTGTFVTALMEPANMGPGAESTNTGRKVASRVRRRPLLRASELAAFGRNASGIMVDSDRELELGAIVTNSIGGHSRVAPAPGPSVRPVRPLAAALRPALRRPGGPRRRAAVRPRRADRAAVPGGRGGDGERRRVRGVRRRDRRGVPPDRAGLPRPAAAGPDRHAARRDRGGVEPQQRGRQPAAVPRRPPRRAPGDDDGGVGRRDRARPRDGLLQHVVPAAPARGHAPSDRRRPRGPAGDGAARADRPAGPGRHVRPRRGPRTRPHQPQHPPPPGGAGRAAGRFRRAPARQLRRRGRHRPSHADRPRHRRGGEARGVRGDRPDGRGERLVPLAAGFPRRDRPAGLPAHLGASSEIGDSGPRREPAGGGRGGRLAVPAVYGAPGVAERDDRP